MTDGNTIIAAPSDFFDGLKQTDIPPRLLEDLALLVQASTRHEAALSPDFIAEVKSSEDGVRARRQACYAGVLGARAMHAVRFYGRDPMTTYGGKAYTVVVDWRCVRFILLFPITTMGQLYILGMYSIM